MNKIIWYIKQLLPLTYRSRFVENGEKHFCVWKMWLGRCYKIDDVIIEGQCDEASCKLFAAALGELNCPR